MGKLNASQALLMAERSEIWAWGRKMLSVGRLCRLQSTASVVLSNMPLRPRIVGLAWAGLP